MKNLLIVFSTILISVSCADRVAKVDFQFVNLGTNEIHSDAVLGMPSVVAGGWLPPRTDKNHIDGTVSILDEPVHVKDQIKIIWQEGGNSRAVELKRDTLGLPEKLTSGKVRFTYMGDGKWSVKLLK